MLKYVAAFLDDANVDMSHARIRHVPFVPQDSGNPTVDYLFQQGPAAFYAQGFKRTGDEAWDISEASRIANANYNLSFNTSLILLYGHAIGKAAPVRTGGEEERSKAIASGHGT
ncbi:unnamed protein product, partial [Effrenium voratum]